VRAGPFALAASLAIAGGAVVPPGAGADSCVGQPGCPYSAVSSIFQSPQLSAMSASSAGLVWVLGPKALVALDENGNVQGATTTPDAAQTGIAAAPDGSAANITNTSLGSVATFLSNGAFRGNFSSKGTGPGQLVNPGPIARDAKNNVYVGDTAHGIQKFNAKRTVVAVADAPPGATSMATDGSSVLLAAGSPSVPSVTRYTSALDPASSFPLPATIENPQIAIDTIGDLWVSDELADVVYQFTATGELLSVIGGLGATLGSFNQPSGATVDGSDDLYVSDTGNARIQKFTLIDAASATLAQDSTVTSTLRSRRGRASGLVTFAPIKMHCETRGMSSCRGSLTLIHQGKKVGGASFSIHDGRTAAVRVPVTGSARKRIAAGTDTDVLVEIRTASADSSRPRKVRRTHTLRAGR
jgi:NHL repeat